MPSRELSPSGNFKSIVINHGSNQNHAHMHLKASSCSSDGLSRPNRGFPSPPANSSSLSFRPSSSYRGRDPAGSPVPRGGDATHQAGWRLTRQCCTTTWQQVWLQDKDFRKGLEQKPELAAMIERLEKWAASLPEEFQVQLGGASFPSPDLKERCRLAAVAYCPAPNQHPDRLSSSGSIVPAGLACRQGNWRMMQRSKSGEKRKSHQASW